jgi:hypothetical protein
VDKSRGADGQADTESALLAAAAKMKAFRGPFLGDGIRPGINGYELADVMVRAAADLKSSRDQVVTQEMVYAAIKECVAQGLLPASMSGEAAYLRAHEQVQAVLAAGMKAKREAS